MSKFLRLLFAGALLAVAIPVQAAEYESERNWLLGLQFGSFKPEVDSESGLSGTPFLDSFGPRPRLLSRISIERFAFKDFGTLGGGLDAGFAEFFGNAFVQGRDIPSPDSTTLRMVPITAFADYRFDWAARNLSIPFVPYAKAGIGGWLFWINDSNGDTAGDGAAKGVRWGWTWSVGLQLMLDVFDPRLSREFDREYGVNGSYLYVDYTKQDVTSFGRKGLDFSAATWSGGIAFEF